MTVQASSFYNALEIGVNVREFGAVGDGVTDDYGAIATALAAIGPSRTLYFPQGTYLVSNTITLQTGQAIIGEGGQRSAKIKRGFNGTLVSMGSLSRMSDLYFDCQGATYSGVGILVASGVSHKIDRCVVVGAPSYALQYADTVGGGSVVSGFEAETTSTDAVGIKFGADFITGPVPRFLENIWLSNSKIDLSSSGNGSAINNFYIRGFVTGPTYDTCGLFHIANGRVSNATPQTIICSDSQFTNISFAPAITLDDCSGLHTYNCGWGTGVTASDTFRYGSVSDQRQAYTPTWSQVSGVGPTLGNGTITGHYQYDGYSTKVWIRLVIGTTTTLGDSSAGWTFSIPRMSAPVVQRGIPGFATIGGTDYLIQGIVSSSTKIISFGYNNQSVRGVSPGAWGAGDVLDVNFSYLNY